MSWHRSIFDVAHKAKDRGLVLYGAGTWGEIALNIFCKLGVKPHCYVDDSVEKQNNHFCGYEVYSLEVCAQKYKTAVYIVCVSENYVNIYRINMLNRLKQHGLYSDESELRIPYYYFLLDVNVADSELTCLRYNQFMSNDIKNLCIFCNMSNSGSYYLEQLLDGHSEILFVPYLQSLRICYEKRLKFLREKELLIEIMAQLCGYFKSHQTLPESIKEYKYGKFVVNANGEFIQDLLVDPELFYRQLKKQFGNSIELKSYGQLIKILFAAYSNTIGKEKKEEVNYWCFYNAHLPNFDVNTVYEMFQKTEFDRIDVLTIIREPLNHIYSWVNYAVINEKQYKSCRKDLLKDILSCDLGYMMEKKKGFKDSYAICFEDLKKKPEQTMKALCGWMNIAYEKTILETTTTNGITVYFPSRTEKRLITGNNTVTIERKDLSSIIPNDDAKRLDVFFKRFKAQYGYETNASDMENYSLTEIKDLLKYKYKFAEIINDFVQNYLPADEVYDVNLMIHDLFEEYVDTHYGVKTEYYSKIG